MRNVSIDRDKDHKPRPAVDHNAPGLPTAKVVIKPQVGPLALNTKLSSVRNVSRIVYQYSWRANTTFTTGLLSACLLLYATPNSNWTKRIQTTAQLKVLRKRWIQTYLKAGEQLSVRSGSGLRSWSHLQKQTNKGCFVFSWADCLIQACLGYSNGAGMLCVCVCVCDSFNKVTRKTTQQYPHPPGPVSHTIKWSSVPSKESQLYT